MFRTAAYLFAALIVLGALGGPPLRRVIRSTVRRRPG